MSLKNLSVVSTVFLLLYSTGASAQLEFHSSGTNQGVLDQVISEFATRAAGWKSIVMSAATWLFWTLGTISLVWTGGMMALRKADIGDFFAEFIRFILFFGFFLWLLRYGPEISDAIIKSLRQLGENAIGVTGISPSGIVNVGFMIWKQAMTNLSTWQPIDSLIGVLLSLGILIVLAVVAVNMLLILVSGWILMYAGIFFLGFGGSRWTSDMAINYYKTVLGIAVQLMAMVLLVGIGNDLLLTFYAKMNIGSLNFEELGVMLVFCLTLLILINRIPPLLSGIITGGSVGNTGIGQFGAGAVVGAAGLAAAAASTGQAMIAAGAANMAGGAQAVMAAFSKASDQVASGSDVLSSMWGGGGAGGSHAPAGDNSTGQTPFAQAAGFASQSPSSAGTASSGFAPSSDSPGRVNPYGGLMSSATKAGRIAVDAGANLARGSSEVAKAKLAALGASALDRIGDTTGGRIAAAIHSLGSAPQDSTLTPQQSSPSFSGNNLSGERQVDAESEIAAFANRDRPPT